MYAISQVSRTNQGLRAAGGEAKRAPTLSTFEPVEWLRERGENGWEKDLPSLKGSRLIICRCFLLVTGAP